MRRADDDTWDLAQRGSTATMVAAHAQWLPAARSAGQ